MNLYIVSWTYAEGEATFEYLVQMAPEHAKEVSEKLGKQRLLRTWSVCLAKTKSFDFITKVLQEEFS